MIPHIAYGISTVALFLAVVSYWPLWIAIRNGKNESLATRTMLCVVYTTMAFEMYQKNVLEHHWQVAAFCFGNFVALVLLIARGERSIRMPDLLCMGFCLVAIGCKAWSASTGSSLGSNLAICCAFLAHTFAWLPGVRGALAAPHNLSRWTWGTVFVSCVLQLLVLPLTGNWAFAAVVPLIGFLLISGFMAGLAFNWFNAAQLRVATFVLTKDLRRA